MLQNDRYTKFVLSVIAACLLWICLRDNSSTAVVQAAPANGVQDVRIVSVQKPQSDKDWQPIYVYTVNGHT